MQEMNALPARIAVSGASCDLQKGVDFKGGGGDMFASAEADTGACCAKCATTSGCAIFTFDIPHGLCYLKQLRQHKTEQNPVLVSGTVSR